MEDRQPMPRSFPPLRRVDGNGPRLAAVGGRQESANSSIGTDLDASDWMASQHDAKPQRMSKEQVALLMIGVTALGELAFEDALRIVNYMTPKRLRAGTVLIRQGERDATHFMAVVLDGTVEVVVREGRASHVLSVLGPGSIIGEMAMVDGDARSASCIAMSHVGVGMLTRKALTRMIEKEPMLATRLMLILMRHVTQRLRETTRRLKFTAQLNDALRAELRAHGVAQVDPALEPEPEPFFEAEPFRAGDTIKLYPREQPD